MRSILPPFDIAPRGTALCRGWLMAGLCAVTAFAGAQDLRFSQALANQQDEAVVQLLKDLAADQADKVGAMPAGQTPSADAQAMSEPDAGASLVWAKDIAPSLPTAATPPAPAAAPVAVQVPAPATPAVAAVPAEMSAKAANQAASAGRDGLPPLGVGDQITIAVFGQPDLSAEVTVGESGTIMVPLIGTLNVLNLSAAQLESMVATRLKDGGYLQNPGVSVQIRQLRSQLVSVIGEVQRPGRYPIQGRMTVLEALATAGGLTQRADKTIVLLRKPTVDSGPEGPRQEISIQLETADRQFEGRLDAPLLNDDVVFVGVQKLFYIHGEVRRPGAYPLEAGMNIMKALSLSGGVSERGSDRRIKIHRMDTRKVLQEMKADPATPLQPDDVVHVDERLF